MEKSKYALLIALSTILAIFLVCTILVFTNVLTTVDDYILQLFDNNRLGFFNWLFLIVSLLGETKIILLAIAVLVCLPNRKKIGIPLAIAVVASAAINLALKTIFQRLRPVDYFLQDAPLGYQLPKGYSFPSGHAQTATVFYFVLTYLLTKHYAKCGQKSRLLWGIAIAVCLTIGISRVYLGVHYFSDIFCGLCLAIFVVCTFILLYNLYEQNRQMHKNKPT